MRSLATTVVAGIALCGAVLHAQGAQASPMIDHIVYAAPDLDQAVARVERLLGVRATAGGSHPGLGTRNALISLGPRVYLEIIAPDPAQPAPPQPRVFGIDSLAEPRLVRWVAAGTDLATIVRHARTVGVDLGDVSAGSRRRPDGVQLTWQLTDPGVVLGDGLVPFFIDWANTPHPAASAAKGATLVELRVEHPEPERINGIYRTLGLPITVRRGAAARLVAVIDGPRGRIELH
ncbi:MAG TPA: VOC family protein [Gemmatimonadaceae bacterium]|nr:VOC family protein [Gemmatimonadaceae bacterium]